MNTLQGELTFRGPDVTRSITLRTPADRRLQMRLYSEIGGFGAGSDFAWQVFPTVSVKLTDTASLEFGYRWLDVDYATGEGNEQVRFELLTQGPVAGFGFRF